MAALFDQIVCCKKCPRLSDYICRVAQLKKPAHQEQTYWGRPVPGFGDLTAEIVLVGLAPSAHGANRTGRPFTGDQSGQFLYPILHQTGFTNYEHSMHREDGLVCSNLYITMAARCAPPQNKPTRHELLECAGWLEQELALLKNKKVLIGLGRIGFEAIFRALAKKPETFAHGAWFEYKGYHIGATYHPSPQNTNTGKLTAAMFSAVLMQAKKRALMDMEID